MGGAGEGSFIKISGPIFGTDQSFAAVALESFYPGRKDPTEAPLENTLGELTDTISKLFSLKEILVATHLKVNKPVAMSVCSKPHVGNVLIMVLSSEMTI